MTETPKQDEKKQIKTELDLLIEIKDILAHTLPNINRKPPIWKSMKMYIPLLLILILSVADLEFGKRANCDIVVTEGTKIDLVKMPEPNFAKYGFEMSPEYWKVPEPNGMLVFFHVSLVRQGLTYNNTDIKVNRNNGEGKAIFMNELIIKCPTTILVEPYNTNSKDDVIRRCLIRTYAFKIGHNEVLLSDFIKNDTNKGHLVVAAKTRIGWRRFNANLSTVFSILTKVI